MIGQAHFREVEERVDLLGHDPRVDGPEAWKALDGRWWRAQGVDYEQLLDWCSEKGRADLEAMLEHAGFAHGPFAVIVPPTIGGFLAAAYHVGLRMGWELSQKARGERP